MINENLFFSISPLREQSLGEDKKYIMICHSSFEPRSLAILNSNLINKRIKKAFVVCTDTYQESDAYRKNTADIVYGLHEVNCIKTKIITANRDKPVKFIQDFDIELSSLIKSYDFLIDISTFPRDIMICLIDYLIKKNVPDISIYYSSPESYGTENKGGWLSKGVRKIAPVPGFNGKQKTSKKSLLIIFLGHELERASISIRNIEPDKIFFITQGFIQVSEDTKMESDINAELIIREYNTISLGSKEIDHTDPVSGGKAIDVLFEKYKYDYNISVSITGTKPQTIGAMLACMRHREIQIVHAYPSLYNISSYSNGIGDQFFGKIQHHP